MTGIALQEQYSLMARMRARRVYTEFQAAVTRRTGFSRPRWRRADWSFAPSHVSEAHRASDYIEHDAHGEHPDAHGVTGRCGINQIVRELINAVPSNVSFGKACEVQEKFSDGHKGRGNDLAAHLSYPFGHNH